jgi:inositol 1,4,5-triphosphate receptor-associated cGMP kinase
VAVLSQSTGRVASSSEQYGAVQQEARVATAIEVMLLHVDNLRRSYEREHTELEETKRVLIEHKLLVADEPASSVSRSRSTRNRSVSVIQPQPTCLEATPPRRSSVATPPSRHQLASPIQEPRPRSRSPSLLLSRQPERQAVSGGGGEERQRQEKKTSVFHPIPETGEEGREEEKSEGKNDNNNNAETDNMNTTKSTTQASSEQQRRKESRKTSHYDVNTILEELDELATRRDSSPPNSPLLLTTRRPPQLPRTARELIQRRKSLLVHLSDWYSDLCWPYDEEETILGLRYAISGILATTAFAILCSTFFG